MAIRPRTDIEPNGCQHCGLAKREHFVRWKPEPVGWHTWTAPTQAQILERMKARRAAREQAAVRRIENALWARMQQTIAELGEGYWGSHRSIVEYTAVDNGTDSACTYALWNEDGTGTVHAIAATWRDGEIAVEVRTTVDHRDGTWGPDGSFTMDGPDRVVVVDHVAYKIGPENAPSNFRGFAGHRFGIGFLDASPSIVTTNLWKIGVIPPKWRGRWPDTARFFPQPRVDLAAFIEGA